MANAVTARHENHGQMHGVNVREDEESQCKGECACVQGHGDRVSVVFVPDCREKQCPKV